jgi:ATP-dependent Clp protease ATP-binding subunit ClpB
MLGRGELRCIGATTLDEYRKYIEKDPALERRFQQVYVGQPSVPDTISILRGLRDRCGLDFAASIVAAVPLLIFGVCARVDLPLWTCPL